MDIWAKKKRSDVMSRIGSKNTKPELFFRKALFRERYRYRTHVIDLAGKPVIVLPKYKTVILFMVVFGIITKIVRKAEYLIQIVNFGKIN